MLTDDGFTASPLRRDPLSDLVVLGFAQDASLHQLNRVLIGSARYDGVSAARRHVGKRKQLFASGGVDVQRIAAAPSFFNALRNRGGVALDGCGGIGGALANRIWRTRLIAASSTDRDQHHGPQ